MWAYLADVTNTPNWLSGVSQTERTEAGPAHEGMVLKETRLDNGKLVTHNVTVTKFQPPTTLERTEHRAALDYVQTFRLRPLGLHCEVELELNARPRNLFGRLFNGRASQFVSHDHEVLARLKEALESSRFERHSSGGSAAAAGMIESLSQM